MTHTRTHARTHVHVNIRYCLIRFLPFCEHNSQKSRNLTNSRDHAQFALIFLTQIAPRIIRYSITIKTGFSFTREDPISKGGIEGSILRVRAIAKSSIIYSNLRLGINPLVYVNIATRRSRNLKLTMVHVNLAAFFFYSLCLLLAIKTRGPIFFYT